MANAPSILKRNPEYDLQVGVREAFLNDALALAMSTGIVPSKFNSSLFIVEPTIDARVSTTVTLQILKAELFSAPAADRTIGLRVEYDGNIRTEVDLAEWTFQGPSGVYIDPGIDEDFDIPFKGTFEVTADLIVAEIDDSHLLTINFGRLTRFDLHNIGDLALGADFNELVRRIFERIGIVKLREKIRFPGLNGLAGSLPAPLKALLDSASGQLGLLDLKIVGGSSVQDPDEVHILLQAQQNLGHQSYADVQSLSKDQFDVAAAITLRWLQQIEQDFWLGDVIPRRFNDKGRPDQNGKIDVLRLSATFLKTTIQVRTSLQRKLVGLPIRVDATLEFRPRIDGGLLFVDLVSSDIDLGLGWARSTGWGLAFFVFRELAGRLLLRAVNVALEPWVNEQIEQFLDGRGVDLRRRILWTGTPFSVDLVPSVAMVSPQQLLLGARLQLQK
ncbi:hypothetical protein [Dongia sp.]|uniref:hypothetical protein n=1 Tax=Dongia sp. TaxID=1977262 RepID=UPI0035B04845